MYTAVNFTIVPGVVVVAVRKNTRPHEDGVDETMDMVVLGEHVACLDAIVAHEGSLSKRLIGHQLPCEDVLMCEDREGVNHFLLG